MKLVTPTRIIIVGGGAAGINAAKTLFTTLQPTDNVKVVLLEKNAFYYHCVGAPRAYTEETFAPKMFIPFDNVIPSTAKSFAKIVRGIVTCIDGVKNKIQYQLIGKDDIVSMTVETMSFDYLILATGSTYTTPIKPSKEVHSRAQTEAQLREVREQIADAESILIVGGGAVGCEVAGDIASKYPNKIITLLESRNYLVAGNNVTDRFRSHLMHSLGQLNVNVIVGERLEERLQGNVFKKRILETNKGREIKSDIQLLCGGFSPVAELIEEMDNSLVDKRGFVKVNAHLQLDHPDYQHIFAIGDVSNHSTPKLAYWGGEQGKFIASQVVALIRKTGTGLKEYPLVTTEVMILPLGPKGGVSQFPFFGGYVVGDWITWLLKSRDMFTSRIWGSLNATVPS